MTRALFLFALMAADGAWPQLAVTPFPEQYRKAAPKSADNPDEVGNILAEPWLLPNTNWVICPISEVRDGRERGLGIVAIDLKTRAAKLLEMSVDPSNAETVFDFADEFPFRRGTCGVPVSRLPRDIDWNKVDPADATVEERRLFYWNVTNDSISFADEPWLPLHRLATALAESPLTIRAARDKNGAWDGSVELIDQASKRGLQFAVHPDYYALTAHSPQRLAGERTEWFVSGPDEHSVIVCQSHIDGAQGPVLECLSPTAPGGRLWSLTAEEISGQFGQQPYTLYLPSMPPDDAPVFVLIVEHVRREWWLMDRRSGQILREVRLPDVLGTHHCAASVKGDVLAISDQPDNPHKITIMLRAFRLSSGELLGELDLRAEFGRAWPRAVTADGRILISDHATIWVVDPFRQFRSRIVFSLRALPPENGNSRVSLVD